MLFDSLSFLCFIAVIFPVYWHCESAKKQTLVLAVASLVFYAYWDWRLVFLLVISVLWTYLFALKQWNIALGIGGLLLPLCFCKYFNFLAGTSYNIVLPLGISFYTFTSIGYLLDVHWNRQTAESDFIVFLTYITFFPQIIAGPIVRSHDMLPQYKQLKVFSYPLAVDGARQFLWGLFKKAVVADIVSEFVDKGYSNIFANTGSTLVIVAIAYAVQIYADFSGYSDMALGVGKLLGIRLPMNFKFPYFASNIGDFWRRWHISLTLWFRDYLYIPLGGSRVVFGHIIFNTWIVFILSGLWHGAAWTFVIWGAIHAMFLTTRLLYRRYIKWQCPYALAWFSTGVAVTIGWIFFRSPDFATALSYLKVVFSDSTLTMPTMPIRPIVFAILMILIEFFHRDCEHGLSLKIRFAPLKYLAYFLLVFSVFAFSPDKSGFIYSQF